jgi:hypothetical protein
MSRANGSNWLSPSGVQRREQILLLARQETRRKRRRREVTRTVAANVVFVAMSLITAMVARTQLGGPIQSPSHELIAANSQQQASPNSLDDTSRVQVSYIQTDPAIVQRLSIQPEPARWQSIDDDELIRIFAEAGQQVGIIRFDGKTEVMTR